MVIRHRIKLSCGFSRQDGNIPRATEYEYILISDEVEHVVKELLAILTAESCKVKNRISLLKEEL